MKEEFVSESDLKEARNKTSFFPAASYWLPQEGVVQTWSRSCAQILEVLLIPNVVELVTKINHHI